MWKKENRNLLLFLKKRNITLQHDIQNEQKTKPNLSETNFSDLIKISSIDHTLDKRQYTKHFKKDKIKRVILQEIQ